MKNIFKKAILILLVSTLGACGKTTELTYLEDRNLEINSEVRIAALVTEIKNGEIIDGEQLIDTAVLGDQEVTINYLNANKKPEIATLTVRIVDSQPPVITGPDSLAVTKGKKIDLLADVSAVDNSLEEIIVKVEGSYDLKKLGEYSLKYVAVDSSGNRAEKPLVLTVKDVYAKYLGRYYGDEFDDDSWIELLPGGKFKSRYYNGMIGLSVTGTYTVSNNILKLKNGKYKKETVFNWVTFKITDQKLTFKDKKQPEDYQGDDYYDATDYKVYILVTDN